MRVLFVNNFFAPVGGAEIADFHTYALLKRHGHEVAYFSTDRKPYLDSQAEHQDLYPHFRDPDKESTWGNITHIPQMIFNREAAKQLKKFIREFKPDIAQVGNIYYHLTPSVFEVLAAEHVPTIFYLHDTRLFCPSGTLLKGGTSLCEDLPCLNGKPWQAVYHRCYEDSLTKSAVVAIEFASRQHNPVFSSIALHLTASSAMRELCLRSGISEDKCMTLPYFVPDNFFQLKPDQSVETATPYFLFMGRISKEKGLDCLIKAFAKTSGPYTLRIIGEGPQKETLQALVRQQGLADRIQFYAHMQQTELVGQLNGCVASIIPSVWFEAFGRTIIESYALGKPVIGSDIGGISGLIQHGETGLLVTPGDSDALSKAIQRFMDEPATVKNWGLKAREVFEKRFSESSFYPSLLSVYSRVISGRLAV